MRELARRGLDVGFTFHAREEEARALVRDLERTGARAFIEHADFADSSAGAASVKALIERLAGVDVLVNNAAINPRCCLDDERVDTWNATLAVNLTGPLLCAQVAARRMRHQGAGGRIVNVTSVLEHVPLEAAGAYCAAKSALGMLTKVMALEWAQDGILVNAVAPGHTVTPMNYEDATTTRAQDTDWPTIPLGRSADPAEIAAVIATLASEDASYSTGASHVVDGGLLLVSGPGVLQAATGLPPTASTLQGLDAHRAPL